MYDNIFETVLMGSNTIYLNLPEQDYFFCYDGITDKAAQNLAQDYFKFKHKQGFPNVQNVFFNSDQHMVQITVSVAYDSEKNVLKS